jgi:hypothetical protein
LSPRQEEQDILQKQERYQISTVFTKGDLKEMPLGYSPGSAIFFSVLAMNIVYYRSRSLCPEGAYLSIVKNFEPDAAWADEKSGLTAGMRSCFLRKQRNYNYITS